MLSSGENTIKNTINDTTALVRDLDKALKIKSDQIFNQSSFFSDEDVQKRTNSAANSNLPTKKSLSSKRTLNM